MDSIGSSSGNQGSGTNAVSGDRDSPQLTKDQLIRRTVMGGMFFASIIFSVIVGIAASKFPWYFTVPICVFGGLIGVFFGMGIEWLRLANETETLKAQLTLERMAGEMRCRRRIKQAVDDAKKECGGFAIESARAVANRVANRLIARYASGLISAEHREATLVETDQVVEEEMSAFQDAIKVESEA